MYLSTIVLLTLLCLCQAIILQPGYQIDFGWCQSRPGHPEHECSIYVASKPKGVDISVRTKLKPDDVYNSMTWSNQRSFDRYLTADYLQEPFVRIINHNEQPVEVDVKIQTAEDARIMYGVGVAFVVCVVGAVIGCMFKAACLRHLGHEPVDEPVPPLEPQQPRNVEPEDERVLPEPLTQPSTLDEVHTEQVELSRAEGVEHEPSRAEGEHPRVTYVEPGAN